MKKFFLLLTSFFGILLVVLIAGIYFLSSFITPDLVVRQLEASLNCRAEIQKININLLSLFSSIEVQGIKVGKRDLLADKGTPLKERKPLENEILGIKSVDLQLSLLPLLEKRFEVKKFILQDMNANIVLKENGGTNLNTLFTMPKVVNGKLNPALDPKEAEKDKANESKEAEKPFNIKELPIAAKLEQIGLKNAGINIYVQKTSQFLKISTLDLVIGFIDVNPKDLENHNSIDFTSSSQLLVLNRKKEELSKFLLASNGKVAPFDSKTGGINPMLNFKLKLLKGSYVTAMAAFDALNSQLQGLLSSDMKSLSEKAELEEDASFQASYGHGVLTFKDDIRLPTKHYTMSLKKESWIQVTNNQHLFHADMTFSRNDSKPLIDSIQTSLKTAQLSEENLKKIQDKILSGFIKEDMLFLTFKSSGNVANPDLSIVSPLPSLKDILKDALSEGLKDKFQEELKKNLPGVDSLKKLF